jgi:hypothetical protein
VLGWLGSHRQPPLIWDLGLEQMRIPRINQQPDPKQATVGLLLNGVRQASRIKDATLFPPFIQPFIPLAGSQAITSTIRAISLISVLSSITITYGWII